MEGSGDAHNPADALMEAEDSYMTFEEALREVIHLSMIHDGLSRGLKECVKALDRREAHLCILSAGCDENAYRELIIALCKEHDIPMVEAPDSKSLGEWAGLCKVDADGTAVKVVSCSCAVIRSWGERSPAMNKVNEEIANRN